MHMSCCASRRHRPTTHPIKGGRAVVDVLKNRPDLAPQCAKLCWTEFEAAYRDMGFPSVQSALDNLNESYMNDDRVPLVLVCVDADDPATMLGTVTLDEEDMSTRPDLAPWVADCFTLPDARGRGVAALLVEQLVEVARSLGQQRIYLWTEHEEAYFSKLGFKRLEADRVEYAGSVVTLMCIDTAPAACIVA